MHAKICCDNITSKDIGIRTDNNIYLMMVMLKHNIILLNIIFGEYYEV